MGGTKGLEDFLDGESDEDAPYQQEEEEEEVSDLDEPPGTSEDDSDASSVETGPPKVTKKVTAPAKNAVEPVKSAPVKVTAPAKKAVEPAKSAPVKVTKKAVEPAKKAVEHAKKAVEHGKKAVEPAKKVAEPAKPPQVKMVKKAPDAAKKVTKKAEKPSVSQDTPFTKASGAVQQSDAKTQAKSAPRKRKGGDQTEAPAEKKKATAKAASAAPASAAPASASATVSQKPRIVLAALRAAGVTLRISGTPAECATRIHCVFEGMGFGPDIFVHVPVRSFSITAPRGSAFFNEAVSSPDDTEQNLIYFSINDADAFMLVYKIRDALGVLRSMVNKPTA